MTYKKPRQTKHTKYKTRESGTKDRTRHTKDKIRESGTNLVKLQIESGRLRSFDWTKVRKKGTGQVHNDYT